MSEYKSKLAADLNLLMNLGKANPTTSDQAGALKARLKPVETRIPGRLVIRNGALIYSKVNDEMQDITEKDCEGYIVHTSSYWLPKDAPTPSCPNQYRSITMDEEEVAELSADNLAMLFEAMRLLDVVTNGKKTSPRDLRKLAQLRKAFQLYKTKE